MALFTSKNINAEVIIQSSSSLIVNLLGLFTVGNIFTIVTKKDVFKKYPMILMFTCLLNFKGNIGLIFIIYINKYKNTLLSQSEYYMRVFYNSNLLIFKSIIIGTVTGIVGILYNICRGYNDYNLNIKMILIPTFSSCIASLLFIITLLIVLELISYFNLETENIVMPFLSAITDLIEILFLKEFIEYFDKTDMDMMILISFFCLCITLIVSYYSFSDNTIIPRESLLGLTTSTCISIISGLIVEKLSENFTFISSIYPFFSGMSLSIALIFLHRNFSTNYSNISTDPLMNTLLFISLLMGFLFIILSNFGIFTFSSFFMILFIGGFVLTTYLMIICITLFINGIKDEVKHIEIYSLPMLNILSDINSIIILLIISYIQKYSNIIYKIIY